MYRLFLRLCTVSLIRKDYVFFANYLKTHYIVPIQNLPRCYGLGIYIRSRFQASRFPRGLCDLFSCYQLSPEVNNSLTDLDQCFPYKCCQRRVGGISNKQCRANRVCKHISDICIVWPDEQFSPAVSVSRPFDRRRLRLLPYPSVEEVAAVVRYCCHA